MERNIVDGLSLDRHDAVLAHWRERDTGIALALMRKDFAGRL